MSQEMLTDAQLLQQRQKLQALQLDLEQLLASGSDAEVVELDQSRQGRLSRMDAMQQQAMAVAKRSTYQKQLREVLLAVKRMEEGDYGFCELCDAPIPFARLQIRPEAKLCLSCQASTDAS